MASRVVIEGVDEIVAEMRRRGINVTQGLTVICNAAADVVVESAASKAAGVSSRVSAAMEKETLEASGRHVVVGVGPNRKRGWIATFLEFGAAAHWIRPRKAKALRIGGRWVRRAYHPGIAARPFMRPAFDESVGSAQTAAGTKTKELLGI